LAAGHTVEQIKPTGVFWTLAAVGFSVRQFLAGIVMDRQRNLAAGRAPGSGGDWLVVLRRWPLLVATAAMSLFLVAIGLTPLVTRGIYSPVGFLLVSIPCIYTFVCFLLLRPLVLFERTGAVRAIQRSFLLVRPRWPKFFAAALIGTMIVVVCSLAAMAAVQLLGMLLSGAGIQAQAITAVGAALLLGSESVGAVYFSALWLALYSVASSSA